MRVVVFFTFLYKNTLAPFSVFSYYLSRRAAMTNYTAGITAIDSLFDLSKPCHAL
uniref:Uncharacterized protein n=1 Tax=Salmonella phage PMBT26 TaxID=3229745 RepID=A0AB39C2G2_9CAUD